MFTCPGGVYSPDLGISVAKTKPKPKESEIKLNWNLKENVK